MKYYYWFAYLLPILIPILLTITCFLSDNEDFLQISWEAVFHQRIVQSFHFSKDSENFYKAFGLFEIIIKSLTLSFFLGTLFYFWKSDQELRNLNVQVHRPSKRSSEVVVRDHRRKYNVQ
jgi:hypothetical protein